MIIMRFMYALYQILFDQSQVLNSMLCLPHDKKSNTMNLLACRATLSRI